VQASHAATLEKVDAEKLFYLLSRGLTEAAAMELLVEGFFREALEGLPAERREDYYSAILKKL
jgi:Fe-S cluster assembly scaffold protein SufB